MPRRFLFWALIAATAWLAATHGSSVHDIVVTARYGSWQWLLIAIVFQAVYFWLRTALYRASFDVVGVRRSLRQLAPVVFGAVYLNAVVPGAGSTSASIIAADTARRDPTAERAMAVPYIVRLATFAGFALVMSVGFGYLMSLDTVRVWEVVSLVIALALVAFVAGLMASAAVAPGRSLTFAHRVDFGVRRLSALARWRRGGIAPEGGDAAATIEHYRVAGLAVRERPTAFALAFGLACAMWVAGGAAFIAVGFSLGWPVISALIAAFAVGTLVWLLSPIPQGIGVVEIVYALMLASFGADAPTALAIAITARILSFWLPLGVGAWLAWRVSSLAALAEEAAEVFPVRLAAAVTFVVGVTNLISALTPAIASRLALLQAILPLQSEYGRLSAALAGAALILLSRGLWRRKRLAWLATVIVLGVSVLSHLVKGLDYEEAVLSSMLLAFLIWKRRDFNARSDTPSITQGLRVVAAAFAITVAYGTIGFFLLDRQFGVHYSVGEAATQTIIMFTQFYNPGIQPTTRFGAIFIRSIYLIGATTFGYALFMLLRPVIAPKSSNSAENARAAAIVRRYGRTPLAAMALLPDKTYFFSDGGSVIAYRQLAGVAVALGDPVGPAQDAAPSIRAFAEFCRRNDWIPSFYQTMPDLLDAYASEGLSSVRIGQDAIVDTRQFTLSGKRYRVERNLVNRLSAEQYKVVFHPAPIGAQLLADLRDVSDVWLAHEGGAEMGFSLGWFDDAYIRRSDVMTLEGPGGEVESFATLVYEPAAKEVSVDLMRHRPSAPAGAMDFLFIRLIEWAREAGYERFNLGFSALSGVGENEDPGVERVLKLVYEYGNRFYSFKGLYAFKNKFQPEWQARYLIYPDATSLPAVFAAIARANSGGEGVTRRAADALRRRATA